MKYINSFLITIILFFVSGCVATQPTSSAQENSQPEDTGIPLLTQPDDPSPSPETFRDLLPIAPDTARSLGATQPDWYKDGVFYHIWVNAFSDSDRSGVGDIRGITQKLGYLRDLGITGIWLSPFFVSSSEAINLHMYDTTDHTQVDPRFGTNADIDALLLAAHRLGIRVIFDWVPNHVSNKHPWFTDSAESLNSKRDWFVWRQEEGSQNGPWGQQVWHDNPSGLYYGVFWSGMPDINFRHQGAKDAITNVAISWLNRGFDGMRVDAVKYLYENPASVEGGYADQQDTFSYFQGLRSQVLDAYGKITDRTGKGFHKFMVAENWTDSKDNLISYLLQVGKPAFHMTLNFPFASAAAAKNTDKLVQNWEWLTKELPAEAWMGNFLSNHDEVAHRPFSLHGQVLVRAVTALQLLGPGTPFIYYGNEIGMPDVARFAGGPHADRRHRQPFTWNAVEEQKDDPGSLLSFYKQLIQLRTLRASLRRGDFKLLLNTPRVFAFLRTLGRETNLVVVNLTALQADVDIVLPAPLDTQGKINRGGQIYTYGTNTLNLTPGRIAGKLGPGGIDVWAID